MQEQIIDLLTVYALTSRFTSARPAVAPYHHTS